ncbi:hypothetical protein Q8A67_022848 [Cirrhinus molitorella]|uniref:Uncharacterized protein n=1 Tax=Cirrhinus molitorella TaxID=172907 RepID=A0AA88P8M1_9TELE|nr:hypothetical protein Q8A67_022848 [Cirrhinus molitorella]
MKIMKERAVQFIYLLSEALEGVGQGDDDVGQLLFVQAGYSNKENLDDVQCWSTTQLRTWDSVTFSSEQDIDQDADQDIESEVGQDEESETVRRQTPYVFHMSDDEEVVDEDMSEEDSIGTELRNASQRHEVD